METINLKVDSLTGNEIIIREGEALPQVAPEQITLTGDIKSVGNFLRGRGNGIGRQVVNKDMAIITVKKQDMQITLMLDPEDKYGTVVTGKLELSDELKKWFINQNKTFKLQELIKLIRFSKLDFDLADKHEQLLKSYQAFNFKAYVDMQQESDQRGNKKHSFEKKVETGLPKDFVLTIPVFKGFPPVRFHVEICLETTEGSANFWFESTELHELIQTERDIILNEELKSCSGFVIINQ